MNILELYKQLPRQDCGECKYKTCMPFAFALVRGETEANDCPLLTPEASRTLQQSIVSSDWREDLIKRLQDEVGTISFQKIADGLGAELRDGTLVIPCFGREFTVSQNGQIHTPGRVTPWIKILLLHYIRTSGSGDISGKWVSYRDLRGGLVKISSFVRDCEEPLLKLLDRDFDKVVSVLTRLGASPQPDSPTPHAWRLNLLPRIPVLILYWLKEEDFPASVKILFDASADRFLDAESLIFLIEGLVKNIEMSFTP